MGGIIASDMRRSLIFIAAVAPLALVGFGCAQPTPPPVPVSVAPTTTQDAQVFPTFAPQETVMTPKDELRQAIQAFEDTKSYRATITADVGNGQKLLGGMEFMRPNRFRGLISNTSTSTTELIVVDNDLYMRIDSGSWTKLITNGSKANAASIRSVLSGGDALESQVLDDSVDVQKSVDAARSCTLYQVHPADDASTTDLSVCVLNSLPLYADISNANRKAHIDFFDYDTVFTIARPI